MTSPITFVSSINPFNSRRMNSDQQDTLDTLSNVSPGLPKVFSDNQQLFCTKTVGDTQTTSESALNITSVTIKNTDSESGDDRTICVKTKFPKKATDVLKNWLVGHIDNPYPSDEIKDALGKITNLNRRQIQNWFTNTRKRYVQPLKKKQDERKQNDLSSNLSQNEPFESSMKKFSSSSKSNALTSAIQRRMKEVVKLDVETKNTSEEKNQTIQKPQVSYAMPPIQMTQTQIPNGYGQYNNALLNMMIPQNQSIVYGIMPNGMMQNGVMSNGAMSNYPSITASVSIQNCHQNMTPVNQSWQDPRTQFVVPTFVTLPYMNNNINNQNYHNQNMFRGFNISQAMMEKQDSVNRTEFAGHNNCENMSKAGFKNFASNSNYNEFYEALSKKLKKQ